MSESKPVERPYTFGEAAEFLTAVRKWLDEQPDAWKWRERIYDREWGPWQVTLGRPSEGNGVNLWREIIPLYAAAPESASGVAKGADGWAIDGGFGLVFVDHKPEALDLEWRPARLIVFRAENP